MSASRIYLSAPCVSDDERKLLVESFDSGWIAPLGPYVDQFEREFAAYLGMTDAAALSSGTAALHLALHMLGVSRDDEVLVSSLTFVATANAVRYVGAIPVFIDSELTSWNIDPDLVSERLELGARKGKLPKAVVAVDVLGQCADFERLRDACARYAVPLIEDAAEALGATYHGVHAGALADIGIFSFNGNKIVTTSGGGMLVARDATLTKRARYLASQARLPAVHYEHDELGFNYRLSGLLAGVGIAQLRRLDVFVERRRALFERYRQAFEGFAGVGFMPEASFGRSTRWLTCLTLTKDASASPAQIVAALADVNIEARPLWKPLHLQPLFRDAEVVNRGIAERLFEIGVCLPSGSGMSDADQDRVIDAVLPLLR